MEPDKGKRARHMGEIALQAVGSVQASDTMATFEDLPVCWICLDCARPQSPLTQPCACPRQAHATCLARWQLQSAGSRRETHCEFCDRQLPDWKKMLTPTCGANAPAVMNVNFDGRTYSFEVHPGPDGYRQFTDAIRRAFSLPDDSELNITFTCDEPTAVDPLAAAALVPLPPPPPPPPPPLPPPPSTPAMQLTEVVGPGGALLTLQGAGAYDAAVHCASVSAARRMLQQRYMGDMLQAAGPFRSDMGAGPSFSADGGSGELGPLAAGAAGAGSDGRSAKKRLPAAFSRKFRNLCDMLSLK